MSLLFYFLLCSLWATLLRVLFFARNISVYIYTFFFSGLDLSKVICYIIMILWQCALDAEHLRLKNLLN